MKKQFILISFLMSISACELTLPVSGQMENGTETFVGQATGYLDGGGTLSITSSHGTVCMGTFVYVTARNGEGTFSCNDGRSGPFSFVSTGTRGAGSGRLGNQPFTFTFG